MKKSLLVLALAFASFVTFAQRTVLDNNTAVKALPNVTITSTNVGTDSFSAHFEPNAECDHFFYLTLTDDDISLWTVMMGMTLEDIIPMWGILSDVACDYTWTDMTPNTTFKIFALPFDAQNSSYSYSYIEVTTGAIGGIGTSVIDVQVSEITHESAKVVCTPNVETAMFYDGLVTVEFYNEIGRDSACAILVENMPSPFYSTDAWVWTQLLPSTDYYVIAFGQNADGVWGDTTVVPFSTLDPNGVENREMTSLSIYPVPSYGDLTVSGTNLAGGKALLYSINGQLLQEFSLQNDVNDLTTSLPAGSYVLRVYDNNGKSASRNVIIVR